MRNRCPSSTLWTVKFCVCSHLQRHSRLRRLHAERPQGDRVREKFVRAPGRRMTKGTCTRRAPTLKQNRIPGSPTPSRNDSTRAMPALGPTWSPLASRRVCRVPRLHSR